MRNCIECDKEYTVEELERTLGKESSVIVMNCCSPYCFTQRVGRAKLYENMPHDKVQGMEGKNSLMEIHKVAKFAFVTNVDSKDEIAVVLSCEGDKKKKKLKGFYITYANGKNADGSFDANNQGLFFGYSFEATVTVNVNPFLGWEKLSFEDAVKAICHEEPMA